MQTACPAAQTETALRPDAVCCVLQNEADAYRKMLLRVEEVQGKFCLTNFWVRIPSLVPACLPVLSSQAFRLRTA